MIYITIKSVIILLGNETNLIVEPLDVQLQVPNFQEWVLSIVKYEQKYL